jgi:hypothetical protein
MRIVVYGGWPYRTRIAIVQDKLELYYPSGGNVYYKETGSSVIFSFDDASLLTTRTAVVALSMDRMRFLPVEISSSSSAADGDLSFP